jgi:hypothetical protein
MGVKVDSIACQQVSVLAIAVPIFLTRSSFPSHVLLSGCNSVSGGTRSSKITLAAPYVHINELAFFQQ